jgi:ABC-type transport system substrate-binding protein
VSLDLVESSVYSERGYTAGNYQMLHSGSAADPDPDDNVYNYFASDGAFNTYSYSNEAADALITKQRQATDQDSRAAALWELEDLLIEDVACPFTFHIRDLVGMGNSVKNYENVPELRSFRTVSLEQ